MRKAQKSGHTVGIVSGRRLDNVGVGRLQRIVDIALEQKREAEIGGVILEGRLHVRRGRALGLADLDQRVIGDQTGADALLGLLLQLIDAGNRGGQRTGADQAHDPGYP